MMVMAAALFHEGGLSGVDSIEGAFDGLRQTVSGNAATIFGGNQGNGNYSVGLGMDVRQKYRFDLKYIDYLGSYRSTNGTAVTSQNGFTTLLKDRGFVSLTFKTTF